MSIVLDGTAGVTTPGLSSTSNATVTGTLGVTGSVGVGTYSDFTHREINGGTQYTDAMRVVATNDGDATGIFILGKELAAGTQSGFLWFGGTNGTDQINLGGIGIAGNTTTPGAETGSVVIYAKPAAGAISTVATFASTGAVTMPAQPAFLATSAGEANVTGNGTLATLAFTTEVFDQGNNFASSTFTAPVTGKYALFASVTVAALATNHTEQNFQIVTSNRTYKGEYFIYASSCPFTSYSYKIAVLADMDAGDTAVVKLGVTGGSLVVDIEAGEYSRFSGFLQS